MQPVNLRAISGHGVFNEDSPATERRKKIPTFTVSKGVTIITYAPPGAGLDNAVANLVEAFDPPAAGDVELVMIDDSRQKKQMPPGYPYRYAADSRMIDYTVKPLGNLRTVDNPYSVTASTPLRTVVADLAGAGYTALHYACCGTSRTENEDFKRLMPYHGYYVRLK